VLKSAGLTGSMGRVAAAGDNAAMESFFALLQNTVLDRRRWRTRSELTYEVIVWIEHTYNRPPSADPRPADSRQVRTRLHPAALFRGGMISHNHRQPNPRQTRSTGDHPVAHPTLSGGSRLPAHTRGHLRKNGL
jgi:hypothetical protein